VKTFLDTKAASRVTGKHQAKLKFELEHFSQFVLGKGLENLGDIKTEHVVAYRNSLTGAQNTRAKKVFPPDRLLSSLCRDGPDSAEHRSGAGGEAKVRRHADTEGSDAWPVRDAAGLCPEGQRAHQR
jgi:hypothetical protein